jgi:hypothetical protein
MRRIAAIALAGALFASSAAYAGDLSLQPGKPAGVQQAQMGSDTSTLVFIGLMAGVIAAVAIGTSNENKTVSVAPPTTTVATTTTTA